MQEINVRTERRTQLVDITEQVRGALDGADGAVGRARLRPAHDRGRDDQRARRPDWSRATSRTRSSGSSSDGWGWKHIEEGEENAPSHIRAVADGPARRSIPLRGRGARARHLAGDLLLRVRRAARAQGLRHDAAVGVAPPARLGAWRARRQGRGARAPSRLARLRRERRRAAERLRRLRPARAARRPRPRPRHEGEAQRTPRRSPWRSLEPGPAAGRGAVRALPGLRRLPLPGSRLRGAGRGEGGAGARRARADRRVAEPPLEPIVPAEEVFGYRNKLEYSFTRTPSGPALGFHRAGRWDEVLEIEQVLAHDRPRQRDPQRRARVGARGAARGLRPGRRTRGTCAISSSARAATPGRRSSSS